MDDIDRLSVASIITLTSREFLHLISRFLTVDIGKDVIFARHVYKINISSSIILWLDRSIQKVIKCLNVRRKPVLPKASASVIIGERLSAKRF